MDSFPLHLPSVPCVKSADCKMSDAAVSSCFPPAIYFFRRLFRSFWMRKIFLLIFAGFCFLLTKLSLQLIRMLHRPLYSVSFTPEVLMKAGDSMLPLLKTRELTYSRICRMLMHCLLQISHVPALSYARLLGFRRQAPISF